MNLICYSNFSLTLPRWSSSTRLVEWCLPQGLEVVATAHWTTWLVVQLAGDGQGRLYYMYTSGVKIYMMLCINILLHFCSYWPCLGETVCLRLPPSLKHLSLFGGDIYIELGYVSHVGVLWRLYNVSFQINLYFKQIYIYENHYIISHCKQWPTKIQLCQMLKALSGENCIISFIF